MKLHYIILQIILGFLLADILSGMFHWFEDTYLDYCIDIPFINQISKDNELHHYFPRSILAYSYLDNITVSLPIFIIISIILYVINKNIFKYTYFIFSLGIFSIISNIIHRFSHMRDCETNIIIKFLHKTGVLCSHSHHLLHHKRITEKYCVVSEYNNYVLDSIYFWRILENIIYLLTGISPSRKNDYFSIHNYMHENAKLICPDTPTKKDIVVLIQKLKDYKKCD